MKTLVLSITSLVPNCTSTFCIAEQRTNRVRLRHTRFRRHLVKLQRYAFYTAPVR